MSGTPTTIRVLHVDDDPDMGALVAAALEREDDRFDVLTAASPDDGLAVFDEERIDCIVSDYDMPRTNGIEFLEAVRERDPDLPFILYTGKGSEEVASDAISAGVTDYLQKGTGTDQYALLANRIDNAVAAVRSREALAEHNRQLETLISNLPGIVYRCRNEPGWPMEFVAGECEATIGYAADQLESGEVVWGEDVLHPDDREPMWEEVQDALSSDDPFEVTYRIRTADDEVRWIWERGRAIGPDDDTIEGFITDVTQRREREQRLEETSARLEALLENSPDMIDVLDPEGRIVEANQRLCEALGYEEEELMAMPIWEIDERVDREDVTSAVSAMSVDEPRKFDGQYRRADGSTFPVEVHLVRIDLHGKDRYLALSRDISQRKRREDALSTLTEAIDRFMDAPDEETVAEHAVDTATAALEQDLCAFWIVDDEESVLRPIAATDAAREQIGTPPTFTGGESITWRAFQEGELTVCEDLAAEPDRYNPDTPVESELIMPLGEYGVIVVGATDPVTFTDVDVSLASIFANTVEAALDRAAREQEALAHSRELERQNERLEEFASIVSYDLRNPLQVAAARAELLQDEVDSEHLDAIERSHDRMAALIDDLLTLGRQGKAVLDIEPVNLAAVARECRETVGTSESELVVEADATVPADRRRLQQLLENLIENAVEHGSTRSRPQADDAVEHGSTSPPSEAPGEAVEPSHAETEEESTEGTVAAATSGSEPVEAAFRGGDTATSLRIRVGTLDDESGFYVADDGHGIPKSERETVFTSGYSTGSDGTGFGLSIVEQIAEAHGWSVSVTASASGGARFEITDVDVID